MKKAVCLRKVLFNALLIRIKQKIFLFSVLSSRDELLSVTMLLALNFLVYP